MTETDKPNKAKHHIKKHKKKYGAAAIVSIIIALLEAAPHIKALIQGDTKPLAEFGKTKLYELQDAGVFE